METYRLGINGILFNKNDLNKDTPNVEFVTHADYKALEDDRNALRIELATANQQHWKTLEELASLKDRVVELVEADREFDASYQHAQLSIGYVLIHTKSASRRAMALEALK